MTIIVCRPRSMVLSVRDPVGYGAAAAAPAVGAAIGALVTLLGAVIAEAEEEQQLTLDARILAQDGQVFHRLLAC